MKSTFFSSASAVITSENAYNVYLSQHWCCKAHSEWMANLKLTLCFQHPGFSHLIQRDHHSADDVQHLHLPGRPCVPAAGEVQGSAHLFSRLPDPQHLFPLLGAGRQHHRHLHANSGQIKHGFILLTTNQFLDVPTCLAMHFIWITEH